MYKDSTYKEKLAILKEWMPSIIEVVKKDLKNEHLKQDFGFIKKYMQGKNPSKLTLEDLVNGYTEALDKEEGAERIAEFIANRWMIQNSELYAFFETELAKVNPDFDKIIELEDAFGEKTLQDSSQKYGADRTYIFAVINSVAFKKAHFDKLQKMAQTETKEKQTESAKAQELKTFEAMKQDFEQRVVRLEDKYEKKLEGLQKKYLKDTDMLKKQVANLQRKLSV